MANCMFLKEEKGAVTIDFVALAAGLLILGVAIVSLLQDEVQTVIDQVEFIYLTADDIDRPT